MTISPHPTQPGSNTVSGTGADTGSGTGPATSPEMGEASTPDVAVAAPKRGGRYAQLPRLAGKSYIPLGVFARVPLAMLTIGMLTLVTAESHSYAIGGFAAGAVGIGSSIGAPTLGFLADKLGQKRILLVSAVLNALMVSAAVVLAYTAGGFAPTATALVLGAAFLSGATSPQVGPMSRVRWMALSKRLPKGERDKLVGTALSLEGTADEVTFALGPALVGLLAYLIAPWLPLVLAAVMTLTLVSLFAVHPTQAAVAESHLPRAGEEEPAHVPLNWFRVAVPVAAMLCMGTFFGSLQTALSAFTGTFGSTELAGLLYAVMAVSSAFAALSVAYWPARFSHTWRWVVTSALMALGAAGLLLPHSIPPMVAMLLLLGIPLGPTMVSIFSIGGMVAPPRLMGTIMTALASGIVAGTAVGSSISGSIAQNAGYETALIVPVVAAGALMLLGLCATVILRKR